MGNRHTPTGGQKSSCISTTIRAGRNSSVSAVSVMMRRLPFRQIDCSGDLESDREILKIVTPQCLLIQQA